MRDAEKSFHPRLMEKNYVLLALPRPIWDTIEFHRHLISALDEAYRAICQKPDFIDNWRCSRTVPGTKTQVRQTPMLGAGAAGRSRGGFYIFANRYVRQECNDTAGVADRCSFERYQDFAFYTDGNWYQGRKVPLLIAEVESNSRELLGELSGLLSIRCPHKYLFIDGDDTLNRLNEFCKRPENFAIDWANTAYHVIEIPKDPSPPNKWAAFVALTVRDGDQLGFTGAV